MNEKTGPKKHRLANQLGAYARYSTLAFHMLAIIGLGVFAGIALDNSLNWHFPVFKLVLSLLSVVLAIYYSIKDFIKTKRK